MSETRLMMGTYDDVVEEEILSVKCIYPELEVVGARECKITIPIRLQEAMILENDNDKGLQCIEIEYLPPIKMGMVLPVGYPYDDAPTVELGNVETWLSEELVGIIKGKLYKLWEDFRDVSIFNFIDYVKTQSEVGFGRSLRLRVDEEIFKILVNANNNGKEAEFNRNTFMCDICQNLEKGYNCTRFECGDTYCNLCLVGYFTHIIERGEVDNVHCPSIECTKGHRERLRKLTEEAERGKIYDFANYDLNFFKMPIKEKILRRFLKDEIVERYLMLFHRNMIERYREYFPNRVSECPRNLCSTIFIRQEIESKLAICPKCNFAYCNDCFHSWHGDINSCSIFMKDIPDFVIENWIEHNGTLPNKQSKIDKEVCLNIVFKYGRKIIELAVNEYIAEKQFEELIKSGKADIIRCPNCSTYIQRSDGCNKMTCSRCQVFFCNLCGDRLNRADPYEHYNNPMGECFGRLFEGIISANE